MTAVVQTGVFGPLGGTTAPIVKTVTATTVGNAFFVVLATEGGTGAYATNALTDNGTGTANTWVLVKTRAGTNFKNQFVYACYAMTRSFTTVTITPAGGAGGVYGIGAVLEASGGVFSADQSGVFSITGNVTTATVTASAVDTGTTDLVFAIIGVGQNTSTSGIANPPTTGYTALIVNQNDNLDSGGEIAYRINSTALTNAATWSLGISGSDDGAMIQSFAVASAAANQVVEENLPWKWDTDGDDDNIDLASAPVGPDYIPATSITVEDGYDWWSQDADADDDLVTGNDPALGSIAIAVILTQEDPWDHWPTDDIEDYSMPTDTEVGPSLAPSTVSPYDEAWDWTQEDEPLHLTTGYQQLDVTPIPLAADDPWDHFTTDEDTWDGFNDLYIQVDFFPSIPAIDDPWDWNEQDQYAEQVAIPGGLQAISIPVNPAYDEVWDWNDQDWALQDNIQLIMDDDDDAVGPDNTTGVPPADAWDHYDGDQAAEWTVIPAGLQQNDLVLTTPYLDDGWDYFTQDEDEQWDVDQPIGADYFTTIYDEAYDWSDQDGYLDEELQAFALADPVGADSNPVITTEDPWDWTDQDEDNGIWQSIIDDDDDAVGPDNNPIITVEDAWDHFSDTQEDEYPLDEPLAAPIDDPVYEDPWDHFVQEEDEQHPLDREPDFIVAYYRDHGQEAELFFSDTEDDWYWVSEDFNLDFVPPNPALNLEDTWDHFTTDDDEYWVDDTPCGQDYLPGVQLVDDTWDWFTQDDDEQVMDETAVGADAALVFTDPWDHFTTDEDEQVLDETGVEFLIAGYRDRLESELFFVTEEDEWYEGTDPVPSAPDPVADDPWDHFAQEDDEQALLDETQFVATDTAFADAYDGFWDDVADDAFAPDDAPLIADLTGGIFLEDAWNWAEDEDDHHIEWAFTERFVGPDYIVPPSQFTDDAWDHWPTDDDLVDGTQDDYASIPRAVHPRPTVWTVTQKTSTPTITQKSTTTTVT